MRFELIKNDFVDHCFNHSATLSILRRAKELNLHYHLADSLSRRAQRTSICLPSNCGRGGSRTHMRLVTPNTFQECGHRLLACSYLFNKIMSIKKASLYRRCFAYMYVLFLHQHMIYVFLLCLQMDS